MADIDLICSMDEVGFVLSKGESVVGDVSDDAEWLMWGFASTPKKDAEEEEVIQKGLNTEPLVNGGWVNWDHDRRQLIGYPTTAGLRDHPKSGRRGLYVEYRLLKSLPLAQHVRRIAKALIEEKAPRSLGLSLEGRRRSVVGGRVLKADVLGLAVTPYPMNDETTTTVLMKGIVEAADLGLTLEEIPDIEKALATGADVGGLTQCGGGASRREEIDGGYVRFDGQEFSRYMNKLPSGHLKAYAELERAAKRRGGRLTKGEAVSMLALFGFPLDHILKSVGLLER